MRKQETLDKDAALLEATERAERAEQVEQRDYNPPKRERLLEWQAEQEFPIVPPSRRPGLWQPLSKLEISRHHLRPHEPL